MSMRALAAGLVAVAALAGCAHRTLPGRVVIKTVTVAPSGETSPSTSPVAAIAAHTTRPVMHRLPGACDDLLSVGTLVDALGHDLGGRTAFVVGLPDRATGRISYLNCRYGIARSTPTGRIEIGVSLYRTAAKAAARIAPTVEDYTNHGASSTGATVAGLPARLLTGGSGTDYAPTVVLADGQRTIVVTVHDTTDAGQASSELLRLALLADRRTSAN